MNSGSPYQFAEPTRSCRPALIKNEIERLPGGMLLPANDCPLVRAQPPAGALSARGARLGLFHPPEQSYDVRNGSISALQLLEQP